MVFDGAILHYPNKFNIKVFFEINQRKRGRIRHPSKKAKFGKFRKGADF